LRYQQVQAKQTREKYEFIGWSKTRDGEPVPVSAESKWTDNADYYGLWDIVGFDIPFDLHPLRTAVPSDFIRGADISNCLEIEQYGGQYKNFDGQVEDIMKILTDNGINYVRIRLWVDPSNHHNHYPGDGNNHIGVTKQIAARAKAAGMKFLLNYHYSDYWADPSKQQIPRAWKDAATAQELYDLLYDYTEETLAEFIAAGATPDMVAIGNEIPSGLLKHQPDGVTGAVVLGNWTQYANALKSGAEAVREVVPAAKIMVQFDAGGDSGRIDTFAQFTKRIDNNAAPTTGTELDYDIIGIPSGRLMELLTACSPKSEGRKQCTARKW